MVLEKVLLLSAGLAVILASNLDTEYPIIYEISGEYSRAVYFGMSVAIRPEFATLQNSWTIQVGAPRNNISGVNSNEQGAVYRCNTYGPCKLFIPDLSSDIGGRGIHTYKGKKDNAWIGVSMDIKKFHDHERTIICGHRWVNEFLKNPENIDITYLINGICYLQELFNDSANGAVQKLMPLTNIDKIYTPKPYVVDLSTYHWGLGQAGISVHMTEESDILIGAPGVTHWVGSVIRYDSFLNPLVGNFAKTDIARKNHYTYIGYSVAAGRFYKDKKLWFVVGAPRSANYRGEVFTFQFHGLSENLYIQSTLTGTSFGEYFGSSLATSDVNGDGVDDLIVGAPLFSDTDPDEGRIYVFLGTNQRNFLVRSQLINGQVSHGRFGTCVASIGDLNLDGYEDVAVGAPYEDNQKGAVYIYRGFSSGLETDYFQRIFAKEIYPYLRGFGISISFPVDIDGNKYQDIAVGSYLSDHVVLFRTRPVITLHLLIKTPDIPLIDRNDTFLNVSLCIQYTGYNVPSYTDVWRTIDVDPIEGRGSLGSSKTSLHKKLIRIKSNELLCENITIFLDLSSKIYSPLSITMRSEVPSCSKSKKGPLLINSRKITEESDGFLKWCPAGKMAETSKEIAFVGLCGADYICRSDLKLTCTVNQFKSGSYVLGTSKCLILSIELDNLGEPAQNVKIKMWSNMKILPDCRKVEKTKTVSNIFWLDVGGTLLKSYRSNFTFEIPFEEINEKTTELSLTAEVFTSSVDTNSTNNKCFKSVKLVSDASVSIHSYSSLATAFISKNSEFQEILNFTHYHEVQKHGSTPLKETEFLIYIPFHFNIDFLTFEVETADWMQVYSLNEAEVTNNLKNYEANIDLISFPETCLLTNRTLFLNCSNPEEKCRILNIFFPGGIPIDLSSYVKILINVNTTAIDSVIGEKDIICYFTSAVMKYRDYRENKAKKLQGTASITVYNESRGAIIEPYVLGLSILAGGFLLSLIVTCLIKNNFFKRTKKEELKALKDADTSFIYFSPENDIKECLTVN